MLRYTDDAQRADMWRELTRDVWRTRLKGVQRNVDVWQALLSVRQLVLPMHEDTHTHLKFASLCRKSGRVRCAESAQLCVMKLRSVLPVIRVGEDRLRF